ncbi:MAG: hypothetical protein JXA64_06515 [Candidatus Fermentibacteraceae bacterium]|nr:hypothetical protein [Candidatus Fermentibacteraceae bacterium]MBN2608750.1 hypothetical protein [Candidatus Fermentibacteraceae bacterium]
MRNLFLSVVALLILLPACGGRGDGDEPVDSGNGTSLPADSVIVMPRGPMEVALEFSNRLGLNDPDCFELLTEGFSDTLPTDSLSPQQIFGRWRAFDAGGRLTALFETAEGMRTSYHCTIRRMERPAINRIDFLLVGEKWLIDGFGIELPRELEDSLTIEQLADLVIQYPQVRSEMHIARMLFDDCMMDSAQSYASMNAAMEAGTDFRDFILDLQDDSYSVLAECNIRRAGKFQIIKDRAETGFQGLPSDLVSLVNIWKEMAFISKSVLRERHEAMQQLYATGEWTEPDLTEDLQRLAGFRSFFLAVSDLVEVRDSLSRTWPVLLTAGSNEPLGQVQIDLDPHQLEQKRENEVGVTVWRALAVELNGDSDPERVIYWAGNLYLFQGTTTGYRLVWRTYESYDSDYHSDFISQPSGRPGCREVTFTGVEGEYEYFLGYSDQGTPLFRRIRSVMSDPSVTVEQP